MTKAAEAQPASSLGALWNAGWYRFARQLASPNFGPRPRAAGVDLIVLHAISLPPGVYGGDGVQQLFTNQLDWNAHDYYKTIEGAEVSAHFYIRRNGELWQFVSANDRAWHAGQSSFQGRRNCNDFSIGIELEGTEDIPYTDAQYTQLAEVTAGLLHDYPHLSAQHITGHSDIAPGRKTDPGTSFDWQRFRHLLSVQLG